MTLDQLHDLHTRGGHRLAECLYLELAGVDLDLGGSHVSSTMDIAIAAMLSAVARFNSSVGVDAVSSDLLADAALQGFNHRWEALCRGVSAGGAA
jgi:hypothetical protein